MARVKYYAVITIIIIVIASSLIYININLNKNKNTVNATVPQNKTVEVPLGPGSVLNITFKSKIPSSNGTLTTKERTVTFVVKSYEWPLVTVSYNISNQTGNVTPTYTLFEIPKEFVGRKSFDAPIAVPLIGEGLCTKFNLSEKINNNYIYTSKIIINNYFIKVKINIDNNGIITNSTYTFYENTKNNTVNIIQYINVTVLKTANSPYKVAYNASKWFCNPPISGDLRFTWEGILLIKPGYKAEMVSINEFRRAIQEGAYVAFLDKGCPHCQKTWPHLLAAVNKTGVSVYAVIFGNLINVTEYKYFLTLMNSNGLTGFPSIVYFRNGVIPGPQYEVIGEVDNTQTLVNFFTQKH